jgi:hypothetical protein
MAKRRKAGSRKTAKTRRRPRKSWTTQALGMLRKLAPIKIMSSRRGGRRKR